MQFKEVHHQYEKNIKFKIKINIINFIIIVNIRLNILQNLHYKIF